MKKPFDLSKFRTGITKSISGISAGFHDPVDWISTGNHTLNYLISGDFNKGIPLGKVSVFAGESGSGKTTLIECAALLFGNSYGFIGERQGVNNNQIWNPNRTDREIRDWEDRRFKEESYRYPFSFLLSQYRLRGRYHGSHLLAGK